MKQKILTGSESFEELIEDDYFFIDKTLFIKELLDNKGKITLITRPRRFGKTLNLSILRSFFDINKDSKAYFTGLKIMEHQEIFQKYMNQYPIIFLTIKDVNCNNFDEAIEETRSLVSYIYRQNKYIIESDRFDKQQKKRFNSYLTEESTINELKSSLKFLTDCLYTYHQKRVIVLMDEYDAPLDSSNRNGYYKEMIDFMRGFMGRVFKSNDSLEFAVLTGVLRIARESLFSSFNNPLIAGIMDKEFSSCFGFTEEEVVNACELFGINEKYPEIKKWYDGYRFGGQDMYNPWSITGYLKRQVFENFWVNTGSIDVFKDVFTKGSLELKDDIAGLLTGKPIMMGFEEAFTYPIEYKSTDIFWSLLLSAGYIKPCNGAKTLRFSAELVNKEIFNIFSQYAQEWLRLEQRPVSNAIQDFVECLLKGDAQGVQTVLNEELLNNPSCHDFKTENSYHMFIFGILLAVNKNYLVYSNHESGKGRSDCLIKPDNKDDYAVVIEFKHCKFRPTLQGEIKVGLINLIREEAQKGLQQINEKAYIHTLKNEGYQKIYKYSIAFYQKNCEVVLSEN
ncbi:MAG: ATP-binding protein [Candidatus Cloacimonetes bacterium]|nr:ATP-binding protein [Candidatus Cloacimonadota bacterium]